MGALIETLYLDTCVLNRPSDDLSQPRIREEAEAISRLFDLVFLGRVQWYTSTVVQLEVLRNRDALRRVRALNLLTSAARTLMPDNRDMATAATFVALGLSQMDALHLAVARVSGADWLITTDDRLIRVANRLLPNNRPTVIDPVDWIKRRQPWLLQP
jgi:predicted nucleic acid-binding protein